MNVLFLNAYNLDAIRIIEAWHYKIYQPDTEEAGFAAQYKANCHLVIYLPDFSEFKHYDVLGIWPEDVGTKDYDWAVSDHVTRQVSFSVDKIIPGTAGNGITGSFALTTGGISGGVSGGLNFG